MARILEAFQLNPSLGGFGNETGLSFQEGDCDAFAQIVKELVDNAVDACRQDSENRIHRVRVEFHQISTNILRVTVTDNGCGMACIQDCVEAFRSSKRPNDSSMQKTSGRYGIGLTLCLLHAQRLVPNSTALITSATKLSHSFQRAEYVVDTEDDCVKCIHKEETLKSRRDESGTSISILVPVSNRLIFQFSTCRFSFLFIIFCTVLGRCYGP
jgi:DNA topoisomerase VI subunit B